MPDNPIPGATPQFGTAEYQAGPAGNTCKLCKQPITSVYYRVNNDGVLCASCADRVQRQIPQDNHAAFVRAIIFGLGGFVVGLVLYAGFTILTDIEIGIVSLAVGWLVGKAMMLGSGGIGGRRYQIVAVLLTYAAVSMAFVPIVVHYTRTHPSSYGTKLPGFTTSSPASGQPGTPGNGSSQPKPKPNMAAAGGLALIGLASPFLQLTSGPSGIIGLIILFVGMRFAWRITAGARIALSGPFQMSAAAKA